MSIKIKKNAIKIVVIVILVIIFIVGGIFLSQFISTNNQINLAKKNLEQINAEELKEKITEELKNSELNINTSNGNQFVMTQFTDDTNGFVSAIIMLVDKKYGDGDGDGVAIPCFRVESNKDGNFKSITYLENSDLGNIVEEAIRKVFKNEYNVDILIDGNSRYNGNFRKIADNQEAQITDNYFWNTIYKRITNKEPSDTTLCFITFGLDK